MKSRMLLKVFLAISLAVLAGWLAGPDNEIFGVAYVRIFDLIGKLFLNALTLVVVPLVASSIITGSAKLGSEKAFGDVGYKTFFYFILTSTLAVIVGILVVNLIAPGEGQDYSALMVSSKDESIVGQLGKQAASGTFDKIVQICLQIIPSNILAVASEGKLLGLIFFSLLFGYFSSRIQKEPGQIVRGFWEGVFQVMMQFTHLVMRALPFGVFGLVAKVVATTGTETLKPLFLFFMTVVIGFLIYSLVVIPLLLKYVARVSPGAFYRAVGPALFTAFSTSSTAATLPLTIECMEKRVGVSNRITSFALPLAASVNMAASAMYATIVVIFIAQVYGKYPDFSTQLVVGFTALLTSMGLAGVPSAVLISIMAILQSIGIPGESIGLILAVERFLDMLRTVVNVLTHSTSTVLVAKSVKEKTNI